MGNQAESDESERARGAEGWKGGKSRKEIQEGETFEGILKFFPHLTTTKKVTRIAAAVHVR